MLGAIPTLAFGDLAAEACGSIVARAGYSRRKLLGRMIAAQGLVPRAAAPSCGSSWRLALAHRLWGSGIHPLAGVAAR